MLFLASLRLCEMIRQQRVASSELANGDDKGVRTVLRLILILGMLGAVLAYQWIAQRDAPQPGEEHAPVRIDAPVGTAPTAPPVCGDGRLDPGEECDGRQTTEPCAALVANAGGGRAPCSSDCTWDRSLCLNAEAECGNGVLEPGELCDDGNQVNYDGCARGCVPEVSGRAVHYDGPSADASVSRGMASSNCRDPADREGYRNRGRRRVPYALVICAMPSGRPAVPVERVRAVMERVSGVFRGAGIRLVEDSVEISPFDGDCRIGFGDPRLRGPAAEIRASGALPIFFVGAIEGGPVPGMSTQGFAGFGYGAAVASIDPGVLVHELGHVFGLLHTHACRPGSPDDCARSGDGVCDTPLDPGPDWYPLVCPGSRRETCGPACGDVACSGGAQPDRANHMGYFRACRNRFTPEQRDLMRCVVENDLTWLDPDPRCVDETCNDQDDDCDGEIDEGDVCDAQCLPNEPLAMGTLIGTTEGYGDAYGGEEYAEGTPDRLFELRPRAEGQYCLRIGRSEADSEPPVVAWRRGCAWDAGIRRSNLDRDGRPTVAPLEVVAGPERPAWISVDGRGESPGVSFGIDVSEGACRPTPPQSYTPTPVAQRRDPLSPPQLLDPVPDAVLQTLDQGVFTWRPVAGASVYEFRVGLDLQSLRRDCQQCVSEIVYETEHTVTPEILAATYDYYWTVRAVRANELGPWAPVRQFEFEPWECTLAQRTRIGLVKTGWLAQSNEDVLGGSCSADSPNEAVWVLVPDTTETICIDTAGSTFDTVVSVRTLCGRADSEIACNDDANGGTLAARVQVDVTIAEPVYILVEGYLPTNAGQYSLDVTDGPCRNE